MPFPFQAMGLLLMEIAGTLTGGIATNTVTVSLLYSVLDVTTGVWV